ncbi:MAG: putative transporter component [Rhodobacteraceae bacterium HLUCCA12]|nr:MAG: putative transporter component [Rhodobacteraceae bacterium HLUCCA12]
MFRNVFAFLAGGLFGAGLLVSGMTNTEKVQGWLDIFGDWDPTLAFVLGGAILPMAVAWNIAARRARPVLGGEMPGRSSTQIDRNLVIGSLMFGAGWGMAGLCPGPAVASIGWGGVGGLVFLLAMIAGMLAAPGLRRRLDRAAAALGGQNPQLGA